MTVNTKLLVAMRRNAQTRGGAAFLERLATHAGLVHQDIALLDPAYSVDLEARVNGRIRAGMYDGSIRRITGASLDTAVVCCREWARETSPVELDVLFSHAPHFAIRCPTAALMNALPALIDLDGNTVTAAMQDREAGFSLDFEGESDNRRSYECDTWA